MHKKARKLFDSSIVVPAAWDSLKKLDPRHQLKNPVMFVVEVGSVLTTALWIQSLGRSRRGIARLHSRGFPVALVYGDFRELLRSDGGRPR